MSPTVVQSGNVVPGQPSVRATIGALERVLPLAPLPFTIGRRPTHSLSIPLPQVSRDHAQIEADPNVPGSFILRDLGSTHGTLVNGARLQTPHRLQPGDAVEFPNCQGVKILFDPPTEAASLFLTQMQKLGDTSEANEFDRLRLLLDFSQRLRSAGGLEEILAAMLDAALRLTGAERGFVFLSQPEGGLQLATGRTAKGESLRDDSSISHSLVQKAAQSSEPILMHDSRKAGMDLAQSVVAHDLRTVLAIPLREGVGVLYLDSHAASQALGKVSREMLDLLAHDAAQLVLNAQLARQQEEAKLAAKLLEKEMALAAYIQQGLMGTKLPSTAFAQLHGISQACLQIGGDFFDAVLRPGGEEVALVLADVSGKGAAAALLAASLQGMVHAQLMAGVPLPEIAASANQFIFQRLEGEKYATLLIAKLWPSGELEYINCGHVQPLAVAPGVCLPLPEANLPVGLLPAAEYQSARFRLQPGARLLMLTDGVTEAANANQEMFGDERLAALLSGGDCSVQDLAAAVRSFCQGVPLGDDLTVVEARYLGTASA
ncbi:MAG: SpoIIE family protein phosphatase [Terriglobales bacterium]|jgi:serine phosphatase RsbU (regulator of sigma subunit)